MKIVKKLVTVTVLMAIIISTVQPAEAAYIRPYGKYKAIGNWSGFILEYTTDKTSGKDSTLIYYKGEKDMAYAGGWVKKVKGNQNKYRTLDKEHYLTFKVYKNKIVVREITKSLDVHFMFEENAKLVFKKIKSY